MSSPQEAGRYEWVDVMGDYAVVPVAPEGLRSTTAIFVAYTGVLACIAALWGGGVLGLQFNVTDMIIVAVFGCLLTAIIGALTAYIGGCSKLSTYGVMVWPYGRLGAIIWGIILSGIPAAIGWYAVETWLFGVMMHDLAPGQLWSHIGVASVWGGLMMMITAYIGIKGILFLSYLTVPFWIVLASVAFASGIMMGGGWDALLALQPLQPATIELGITQTLGLYVVGAVIAADVGRFAKNPAGAAWAWAIQVMVIETFFLLGAGFLTLAMGGTRITEAMLALGVGLGAYLLAILGQWTTNDSNLYYGTLAFTLLSPVSRRALVLICGVIGTAVAAYVGFVAGASFDPFIAFLTFLGSFIPAIGGTIIADFYLYRGLYKKLPATKRYELKVGDKFPEIDLAGWISTIVASALGTWVVQVGIPAINSLVIAMVIYTLLAIALDKSGKRLAVGEFTVTKYGLAPRIYIERYEKGKVKGVA